MKPILRFATLVIFLCLNAQIGFSQNKVLKGTITTFKCILLNDVTIQVKSTEQTVLSDSLGQFKVWVADKDKITISANGFKSKKVIIKDGIDYIEVDLKLKQNGNAVEQAIDYGHVNDRDKLLSVFRLNNKEFDFSRYNSMYEVISGRFPNVVIEGNGDIVIRGKSSLEHSSAALIVIDGVVTDNSALNNILPSTVKSIDILKGSEAARYGSRGANGVVVIKTLCGDEK